MAENPDDVLHVEGGKPLNGTIKVRGAKNFVSKGDGRRVAGTGQVGAEERAGDS